MYRDLPEQVRASARRAYRLFQLNPSHPGLHFKKVDDETLNVLRSSWDRLSRAGENGRGRNRVVLDRAAFGIRQTVVESTRKRVQNRQVGEDVLAGVQATLSISQYYRCEQQRPYPSP